MTKISGDVIIRFRTCRPGFTVQALHGLLGLKAFPNMPSLRRSSTKGAAFSKATPIEGLVARVGDWLLQAGQIKVSD